MSADQKWEKKMVWKKAKKGTVTTLIGGISPTEGLPWLILRSRGEEL